MSARRTERLLNLVIALLSTRRGLRKEQLRTAVPQYAECATDSAFERMFERDKEDLREIGVPLETVVVDVLSDTADGYRIDASAYVGQDVQFSPAEVAVLGLASRVWQQATFGGPASRALLKLSARGSSDADGVPLLGVDPSIRTVEPAFAPLYAATRDGEPVSFGYRRPDGSTAQRRVEPWQIVLRRGTWYLLGLDLDRGAPRVFRLARVLGRVTTVGEPGTVRQPTPQAVQAALAGLAQPSRPHVPALARVLLRHGRGGRLRARVAASGPAPPEETTASAEELEQLLVPMHDLDHLASDIASLADDVRVLAPTELLEEVLRRWRGVVQAHEGPAPEATPTNDPTTATLPRTAPVEATGGAPDRLSRLLALVPYVLQRGEVATADLAGHFAVSEAQLVRDLELLFVCGTPGHMPDDLIEAEWEQGMVRIGNAEPISRPLRLSVDEVVALRLGLQLLHDVPGPHDRATLTSAADKLSLLGAGTAGGAGEPVGVLPRHPGPGRGDDAGRTATVQRALAESRRLHLRYLSAGRDELTERDVDPRRFVHADGRTYVEAWCHRARGVRLFRLDRVVAAQLLDVPVEPHPERSDPDAGAYVPGPDDLRVVLRLHRGAGWLREHYPGEVLGTPADEPDAVDFALGVADVERAERLVLGLDGAAEVLQPQQLRTAVAHAARAALQAHADVEPATPNG